MASQLHLVIELAIAAEDFIRPSLKTSDAAARAWTNLVSLRIDLGGVILSE